MTDLVHCNGCVDDFYNGQNPLGVRGCWHRKSATMVTRIAIPIDMAPPYLNMPTKEVPSCYRKKRHCMTDPQKLDIGGYWR